MALASELPESGIRNDYWDSVKNAYRSVWQDG